MTDGWLEACADIVRAMARRMDWIIRYDNSLDIDDLMQIGWLTVWQYGQHWQGDLANFKYYCVSAIRSNIMSAVFKNRRSNATRGGPMGVSLDKPIGEKENGRLGDLVPDDALGQEELVERKALRDALRTSIEALPQAERDAMLALAERRYPDRGRYSREQYRAFAALQRDERLEAWKPAATDGEYRQIGRFV